MSEILSEIKGETHWSLAVDAESSSPDSDESAGARFLRGIRDSVIEAVEWRIEHDELSLAEAVEDIRYVGADGEIADGAVPVYTYDKWLTFTDLGAWTEDVSEIADTSVYADLDTQAGWALYLIAYRLVAKLLQDIEDNAGE
ncbi:Ocr-like antirestriction protein [Streptomyces phage phiScoe54]|nr:Ocr-like antirestriction protein [Streptomyces phage phiScoe54]